jgi:sugar lactone lactonase YvrE
LSGIFPCYVVIHDEFAQTGVRHMVRNEILSVVAAGSLVLALAVPVRPVFAETIEAPFTADRWELADATVTEHLGRQALCGTASLKGVEFENGVIEFDLAVSGEASYPGIAFRMEGDDQFERVYFRPHRAGRYPDALQYTPTMNGIEEWQLCNGPGFTAGVELIPDRWIHVRLEVMGTRARVYVNGAESPTLEIYELRRGDSKGGLALVGENNAKAHFSNVRYRLDGDLDFGPAPIADPACGVVADWEISQPFPLNAIDDERSPAAQGLSKYIRWRRVAAEPSGLVDLGRYVKRLGREPNIVCARTTIRSNGSETKKLLFGYSDAVSILLNGRLLFSGGSSYRYRDPSFLGIAGYFDTVVLPLRKGDNELLLYVAEATGGWGFMCRDGGAAAYGEGVSPLWETPRSFRIPESAVYDPARDCIYVSNFDGYKRGAAGKQSISKLALDGTIEDPDWIAGLTNPTGLALAGDTLYAVCRASLAKIALDSRRIVSEIPFPRPVVPNDVAIAGDGTVYVSDSYKGCLYRVAGAACEEWLAAPELASVNGICFLGDTLVAGKGVEPAALYAIDTATKRIRTIARWRSGGIDGIEPDGRGNVLAAIGEGKLFRVSPSGRADKLIDTTGQGLQLGDIAYVPEKGLLLVPRVYYGSIAAYRLR